MSIHDTLKELEVTCEVVEGEHTRILSIDDHRITDKKMWGVGKVLQSWTVKLGNILDAIPQLRSYITELERKAEAGAALAEEVKKMTVDSAPEEHEKFSEFGSAGGSIVADSWTEWARMTLSAYNESVKGEGV